MTDIKDRAREYLAEHSKYSEVFGQTFVAVDTLTAMVEFAEQETKELKEQIKEMKSLKEEIITALKECPDYVWLHAHNGKAKHTYLQSVIDIVNEKFEEIKEND